MYKELAKHDLQYIEVKETTRRKMGIRKLPFFIDGICKLKEYEDHLNVECSFGDPSKKDLTIIEKMRHIYNIPEPHEFVGK